LNLGFLIVYAYRGFFCNFIPFVFLLVYANFMFGEAENEKNRVDL
jgi:hypothetical protein